MTTDASTCQLDDCSKPALASGKGVGYCSLSHADRARRIRTGKTILRPKVRCAYPTCDAEFRPRTATQKYCCAEHRMAHQETDDVFAKTGDSVLICGLTGCDERARTVGKAIGFCSQAHYHVDWRIRTGRRKPIEVLTCPYPKCAAQFIPNTSTQIYCCRKHKDLDSYRRNPETHKKSMKKRMDANPDLLRKSRERAKAWAKANPEAFQTHMRRRTLKLKGVSLEAYDAMKAARDGACWLCGTVMTETTPTGRHRSYHVDHDHAHPDGDPAGVRGLLDTWCNTRLHVVENVELVARIDLYLATRASYQPPTPVDSARHPQLWHRFGLTVGQYDAMLKDCDNRCEICHEQEKPMRNGKVRPLSVDHDHTKRKGDAGFVRGLLCNNCNSAVGVRENTAWWAQATAYLAWAPTLAQDIIAAHPLPSRPRP